MALSDPISHSRLLLIPGLHHHCTGCQDESLDWQSAILIIFCCLEHLLFQIGAQLLSMCWSSWTHLHSSDPYKAFHYNCRLNTDGLDHIFTGSNSGTTTGKVLNTFSHIPIGATTATQTDLLGQFHKMWNRLSALEWCLFCENDLLTKMYLGSQSHNCVWVDYYLKQSCCDTKQADNNVLPIFAIPHRSNVFWELGQSRPTAGKA